MKQVVILGAGTSVNEGISNGLWQKIKGLDVWSLNSMFKIMPYLPTRQLWVDRQFFERNIGELQDMHNRGVKLYARKNDRYALLKDAINQFETTREPKLYNNEKKVLYYGDMGLTGLFAISLAIYESYDLIYLLGYDWGSFGGVNDTQTHCYQSKINDLHIYTDGAGRPKIYFMPDGAVKRDIDNFKVFLNFNKKIINVSLKSHITAFEKINYDEFYRLLVQ